MHALINVRPLLLLQFLIFFLSILSHDSNDNGVTSYLLDKHHLSPYLRVHRDRYRHIKCIHLKTKHFIMSDKDKALKTRLTYCLSSRQYTNNNCTIYLLYIYLFFSFRAFNDREETHWGRICKQTSNKHF